MIKICYLIGQLGKGGAEKQLYELVKGINRKVFDPVVISLNQGGYWGGEIRKLNIRLIELQRKRSFEFARLFKLIKILKAEKPDIVHTYMFAANSYGRIAAIIDRVPVIIASERNLVEIGKDKNKFDIYIDKLLAPFSQGIICNSDKASKSLVEKYSFNGSKVFTVHNGIDASPVRNGISNRIKIIGTVGSLYPQKNHSLFLDMAKIVLERSENKDIKFLIVGKGPLRNELERCSKALNIESNVAFAGEREDVPELLQTMDIFVMTSLYEGLPNAIIEAMAAGLPVIATDVGGNSELVINRETGFLCRSNDAKALAEKVVSLINNEQEAKRMGKNGKKRALSEFGVERMIRKTENIYMELLG
jgi:glycosyltransferase involved in cell wall biosynthesis